ncbi:DNA replication/repair protein RecF [Chondromyces apiculatus]|uniref:DNA replication and repair protein RecF n=1 Tax=Chondromyces apiculatus DSM 436 TaxID=1192034 RepID=A0A017T465_9BACT|nr:DNA replication and repair protein RecF [Chondromyces apiculatus]EYF03585.1 DNA recombination and repair protein RecF [Chondromyces apiculatus DSM 436]
MSASPIALSLTTPQAPGGPGGATPPSLLLERLLVRGVRNVAHADVQPAPRVNVIWGNNGHGKTSLLEAIYFAATSRSFRAHRMGELVQHGEKVASVRARFVERWGDLPPLAREQVASIEGRRCAVLIDGNRPPSLASFATRSPVVAFHPNELSLTTGPASGRRTLLDRLALFMDPRSADHRARYDRALRARHEVLRRAERAEAVGDAEIEAFEELCAVHGAAVTRARAAAVTALGPELEHAFAHIAAPGLSLSARYAPGGSADVQAAREALAGQRRRDAHRPSAGFGPHRDDLELSIDGHPVRVVASQGQHRALTLALKAAETATIRAARGVEPILLLDDVSSELDPDRTEALLTFLGTARGQVFLTTTRRELIVTPGVDAADRRDFRVQDGAVTPLSPGERP